MGRRFVGLLLTRRRVELLVRAAPLGAYMLVLIRTAWLSDDAYLTFRTIDNLFNGFGLTWNPPDRVQAYTHPLWLLVVAGGYAVTGKLLASAVATSILISLGTVLVLVTQVALSPGSAALSVLILTLSRAFVDYSTSGLENPLSHLLLIGFAAAYFRPQMSKAGSVLLFGIAGLAALNRLDSLIIFIPALWQHLAHRPLRQGLFAAFAGLLPLALWEAFSVVYYGFPLPNSAYAKLSVGIPFPELAVQGLRYVSHPVLNDPITAVGILGGIIAAGRSRQTKELALTAGIGMHVAYTVWIGGDFMAGRFFSLPLLASTCILARQMWVSQRRILVPLLVALLAGLIAPYPTLLSGRDYGTGRAETIDRWGISDERAVYYPYTGLLWTMGRYEVPYHPWMEQGIFLRHGVDRVVRGRTVGFLGYFAGPEIHIVDEFALADALLARLPANIDPDWRPGHFDRSVPDGYMQSLSSGSTLIRSEYLRHFYEQLRLVIRGPIWEPARLRAIVDFNTGVYGPLVDNYVRGQYVQLELISIDGQGQSEESPGTVHALTVSNPGAWIDLGQVVRSRTLTVELQPDRSYALVLMQRGRPTYRTFASPASERGKSAIKMPRSPWQWLVGYDGLLVVPLDGQPFVLGRIEIADAQFRVHVIEQPTMQPPGATLAQSGRAKADMSRPPILAQLPHLDLAHR